MARPGEFVPDINSPANGVYTSLLDIVRQNPDRRPSPRELRKKSRTSDLAQHVIIEAGSVGYMAGIRALKLWSADGPGNECLSVEEAKLHDAYPAHLILATPLAAGRLVLSSSLGRETNTTDVEIPAGLWAASQDWSVENPLMTDLALGRDARPFQSLVYSHWNRVDHYGGGSVQQPADPRTVDLPLATLLARLPESRY